jgi:hypothetical protein
VMMMARLISPKIKVRQIVDSDISAVVDLLTKGFPRRRRPYWQQALERLTKHSTPASRPKYGYLLEVDDSVVGVLLLIFTSVGTGVDNITWCNVSGWYVEPPFRSYAPLLTYKAFSHKNVTYLNVSPAKHVQPIIEAQGFVRYSNGQFVALPVLSRTYAPADIRVFSGAECPAVPFETSDRDLLLAHIEYGCIGLWCATSQRAYPFVFVPRIVKKFVPCVQLIYCRQIDDFVRFARPIGRYLTLRGRPLVIVDSNGTVPGLLGHYFDGVAPKYFKGAHQPRLGNLAFTEAAMFGI